VPTADSAAVNTTSKTVPTQNFFAPLRASSMDTDSSGTEASPEEEATPGITGRPPTIVITASTNLMQLQKVIQRVVKENFEFRNTKNGTKVITKTLADYAAVKSHLKTPKLPHFTFYPKSPKPNKAVIRHLPMNIPAQDISEGLTDLISVKKMSTTRRSPSQETSTRRPISLLSTTGKLSEKVILKILQKHIEGRGLLNEANLVSVHVTA
jgi:hypothetical protein